MHAVVRLVPSGDQFERRRVQTSGPRRVRKCERNNDQAFALQFNHILAELLGNHEVLRKLAWKTRLTECLNKVRRGLFLHHLNSTRRRDKPRVRKTFQKHTGSEEMIAMSVRSINGRKVFPCGSDQ